MAQARKATLYIEVEHQGVMRPVRFEKEVPTGVRVGSYYLRYRQSDGKRKWENVGTELNVALREQKARQASVNNSATLVPTAMRSTLTSATATYLSNVQMVRGTKAHKRAKRLLTEFSAIAKETYVDEVSRETLMHFQKHLKDGGSAPKTIRDRLQSVQTFLKQFDVPKLLRQGDLPKVTKKIVDCYSEVQFAAMIRVASDDERFLLQFFIASGMREQEVAHCEWHDVKLERKVVRVSEKLACRCSYCGPDGFRIKDCEEREIPLPDWFTEVLNRRKGEGLLFANSEGRPEGHMLHIIQRVGLRARVSCGRCALDNGETCATKPVCRNVGCHKFRRTFATWNHVLGGVSIAVLQKWLGHSDIETTMRYISTSEIRKGMTEQQLSQTWAGIDPNPPRLSVVA
jgi:integrase/recombinase XerD